MINDPQIYHTSADILAILSGGINPIMTPSFNLGFFLSFRLATLLLILALYFWSVFLNSKCMASVKVKDEITKGLGSKGATILCVQFRSKFLKYLILLQNIFYLSNYINITMEVLVISPSFLSKFQNKLESIVHKANFNYPTFLFCFLRIQSSIFAASSLGHWALGMRTVHQKRKLNNYREN